MCLNRSPWITVSDSVHAYASAIVGPASFAVSLEQAGGSPDGAPHADSMFKGKLIQTVPGATAGPGQPTKPQPQ